MKENQINFLDFISRTWRSLFPFTLCWMVVNNDICITLFFDKTKAEAVKNILRLTYQFQTGNIEIRFLYTIALYIMIIALRLVAAQIENKILHQQNKMTSDREKNDIKHDLSNQQDIQKAKLELYTEQIEKLKIELASEKNTSNNHLHRYELMRTEYDNLNNMVANIETLYRQAKGQLQEYFTNVGKVYLDGKFLHEMQDRLAGIDTQSHNMIGEVFKTFTDINRNVINGVDSSFNATTAQILKLEEKLHDLRNNSNSEINQES